MKKKLEILLGSALIAVAIWASGCCGRCDDNYLGLFPLNQEARDWIEFPIDEKRIFTSDLINNRKEFTYELPEYDYEMLQINCEQKGNCGNCCDNYESQVAFLGLRSEDGTISFNINLRKDFLNHTPAEKAEDIGEFFSMTMNNRLTGELFLDDPKLINSITLNGTDYTRVFGIFADATSLDTLSSDPAAFYFKEGVGIVGYTLANGKEWNLQ